MQNDYNGQERRQFIRLDYVAPLAYKICSKETISKLLQGYTSDISQAGLLCNIKDRVSQGDILWLSFDRSTLEICAETEKRVLIYQNGIIGTVVRVETKDYVTYCVGIKFITREEQNLTHIYPKINFVERRLEDNE